MSGPLWSVAQRVVAPPNVNGWCATPPTGAVAVAAEQQICGFADFSRIPPTYPWNTLS